MSDVLLGVLTATDGEDQRRLGAQTIDFKTLARVGRRHGVRVVVFKPPDVGIDGRRIRGYAYRNAAGGWRRVRVRWPDVVYNRVPRRSMERRSEVQEALKRLRIRGIPVFNPGFLDKQTVYEAMADEPELAAHVPPTLPVASAGDVRRALEMWREVYLKPVEGSLGRGIVYVAAWSDGGFTCHACVNGVYRKGNRRNWRSLRRLLQSYLAGRRYLVQAGIQRPLYRGCVFDVRSLAQKDADGVWRLSGMAARVAAPGRVLTHVPRGGSHCDIRRVLVASLGADCNCEEIVEQLETVARRACHAVDTRCAGLYAELSVDLTLDRRGGVWVLECNAKPGRFDEDPINRRHLRRVIAFARGTARYARQPPSGGATR